MHGLLKQPGYRLHPPESPEASALLAEQGLGSADLDRALAELERTEGTMVRIWMPSVRSSSARARSRSSRVRPRSMSRASASGLSGAWS